nr:L-histidine N(alpha)-methyltransferase [Nostoc sp. NMS9]
MAWDHACNDRFYLVIKESIESFRYRWHQINANNIKDQKYHYVSLGVGTGEKDQHILSLLFNANPDLLYFPVDMSSEMLRLGVQRATRGSQLQGSHVLPIQVDFSIERNVDELRKLLDRVINNSPVLFSLLGNTLANFRPIVFPRLIISVTETAIASDVFAERQDRELFSLLHQWRHTANEFNRRLDITELRTFTNLSPQEIRSLYEALQE